VEVIGPWPKKKALRVSNQKCEAAISMDSFLAMFDKERSMHWPMSYWSQSTLFEANILRYQFSIL
jgi:hypothetical protein